MSGNLQNWAANYRYRATRVHRPRTVPEIQELVSRATKVKALGTRHSFNDIADSAEDLISMENFDRVISLDRDRRTVTVKGGIRYGELAAWLDAEGFGLHNLASLPHISVAGACATATHGSGIGNGNLSTAVSAMEFVVADGSVASFSREANSLEFDGMVVHLGGLGIVTRLTLDVCPSFELGQTVYEDLPFDHLAAEFDQVMGSAYSVSLFTRWGGAAVDEVWVKRIASVEEPAREYFGARAASSKRHPIRTRPAENCTEQMGASGRWHERLPHFRLEYTPSSGEELQSEYFVAREVAAEAIRTLWRLADRINPLLQISEIRTIASDCLWMSPCYERESVSIHFTWLKEPAAVTRLLPTIEEALTPFSARPHWAKLFSAPPADCYARLPDFRHMLQVRDPNGKFRNDFLERSIF